VGERIAGFPFVPFNLFNVVRDYTPGGLITFAIDSMISIIHALNLGETDSTAKMIEQALAIAMILVIGIVAGAIFFYLMQRVERRQEWLPGVIFGLIVGVPLTALTLIGGTQAISSDSLTSVIWLVGLFLIWGYAHNWVYNRLTYPVARMSRTPDATAQQIDRRQFLIQVGGATAAITVVGALVGNLAESGGDVRTVALAPEADATPDMTLPNANAAIQPAPGTRPEVTPVPEHYRIDIALSPPEIDLATWTLPFMAIATNGDSTQIAEFTMDDIRNNFEPMHQYITQGCISNRIAGDLISTVRWTGASLQKILEEVDLPANATHLKLTGADGFDETIALDRIFADPTIMLAYDWDGEPIPVRNGFPLRIHIPNHYGMKQPKWITGIEVLPNDEDGYWVRRGWDKEAIVRSTAVIDTVATNQITTEGDQQLIPIGGIAWAGSRGISKVEISIDDGDWTETQLRDPLSDRTWVIWRYDWAFTEGDHTFAVRCYDGSGEMQITEVHPEHPSGATGIHEVSATI
jgi:DMSO/TMAO reductase YedYZ molybdopterin-dependent catalytic subunit